MGLTDMMKPSRHERDVLLIVLMLGSKVVPAEAALLHALGILTSPTHAAILLQLKTAYNLAFRKHVILH